MTRTAESALMTALAIGLSLWGLGGCDRAAVPESSPAGLNVILISIDTTRADHLACYGHPQIKTPSIDRLAAEGILFAQCTSAAPVTLPSHASMLTGTYPFVHKVRDNSSFQLHADNLTLAEVLGGAGLATAAQVGAFVLNHEFGLDQGFAAYRDVGFATTGEAGQTAESEITAEQVTDGAIELLRAVDDRRFFLFVHYFDPHRLYRAPRRFADEYRSAYVAEIAYTDEQIGRLLVAVHEADVADRTLIVLTSDHGEGLGQHKESTHAYFVYDATLRVPLIFWCPGRIPAGTEVATQVRTIDIAPTILALLGLPPLPDAQGVDLSPMFLSDELDDPPPAYAETFYPKYSLGLSQLRALRDGQWKYIHASPPELYHVADDPGELDNLAAAQPDRVARMRATLRALIEQAPCVVDAGQARRQATPEDLRRIESLGYVGSTPVSDEDQAEDELALFDPSGPNPMENARQIELMTQALGAMHSGQPEKVVQAFGALLAEGGERSEYFVNAHTHLASALAAQGKLRESLRHLNIAARTRPDDGRLHAMKGITLRALGRNNEAIAAFEQALPLEPRFAETHVHLADTLVSVGRPEQAIEQYRQAIGMDPTRLQAYTGLARLCAEGRQFPEALEIIDQGLEIARSISDAKAARELENLRRECE